MEEERENAIKFLLYSLSHFNAMHIQTQGQIVIHKNASTVFAFIANLENDKLWRKEINETIMNAPAQLGVLAKESSFLSKRVPAHVLELRCTQFILNKSITYTTLPSSPFYLQSIRKVEEIDDHSCRFIYEICFDQSIVKHGLGFGLPAFLIRMVAQTDMKKYLLKVKELMELFK
jgi:hypothetical protein